VQLLGRRGSQRLASRPLRQPGSLGTSAAAHRHPEYRPVPAVRGARLPSRQVV